MKAQKALVLLLIAVASLNPSVKINTCYFEVLKYSALASHSMWMSRILALFAALLSPRVSLYGSLVTIGIGSYYCNSRILGCAGHVAPTVCPWARCHGSCWLASLVPYILLMSRSSTQEKVLSHRGIPEDIGDVDLHCEVQAEAKTYGRLSRRTTLKYHHSYYY